MIFLVQHGTKTQLDMDYFSFRRLFNYRYHFCIESTLDKNQLLMYRIVGILIGRYWASASRGLQFEQDEVSAKLMNEIDPTNIDAYLK